MLLLGVIQAQAAGQAAGSFDLLETQVLSSSAASVTFSNLNTTYGSTYDHLQLRIVARTSRADTQNGAKIRFNGGTQTDYSYHQLLGNGSSVSSFGDATATYAFLPINTFASANATANIFGASILDILDAFNSSKNTTLRALGGQAGNSNAIALSSAAWFYTDALTSMTIEPDVTSNWVSGSRFSIYGWKAA